VIPRWLGPSRHRGVEAGHRRNAALAPLHDAASSQELVCTEDVNL